jgi:hypothetical protein
VSQLPDDPFRDPRRDDVWNDLVEAGRLWEALYEIAEESEVEDVLQAVAALDVEDLRLMITERIALAQLRRLPRREDDG